MTREDRHATRERFRAMFPRQGGWVWLVAAALGALQLKSARDQRNAARHEAEKQAAQARANAEATAQQARANAVQTNRAQQLAAEREALAARAAAMTEENTQQANQKVDVSLGGEATDQAVETSKRRKQFFQAGSGGSQSGGGLAL